MSTVLIVDDDLTILSVLEQKLRESIENINILKATNYKESVKHILNKDINIDVALIDVFLPDVKDGFVVDFALKKKIPTLVLTSNENLEKEKELLEKPIVEYIRKNTPKSIDYAVKSIARIIKNYDTNILIVDDSPLQLKQAADMASKLRLNITTAMNGEDALKIILDENKKFSLVLTDYNMPKMDGMELTMKIREIYDKDELAIIVLSINDSPEIPTQFLRMGANDFINKPFTEIEIKTRINANLELLDLFQKARDLANKDFLTGVFNRRYFFNSGQAIFAKANRKKQSIAVAMFDIDHFKKVNDTYGHHMGDIAIKETARIITQNIRSSDLVARFGGEEFCVLLEDITPQNTLKLFEKIRAEIENHVIEIKDVKLNITLSIGICYGLQDTLEKMINISDQELYKCKNNGRNRISMYTEEPNSESD